LNYWVVWFLSVSLGIFGSIRTDYPLVSKDTFFAITDHFVDISIPLFDPLKVKRGDIVFIDSPCLQDFFRNHLPKIQSKFILVTGNGCRSIDKRYLPFLENPYLVAWFGMNMTLIHPKTEIIPVGIPNSRFPNHPDIVKKGEILKKILEDLSIDLFFKTKPIHTCLNTVLCSHCSRTAIQKYFATQSYCHVASSKPFLEYIEDIKNSRFVISPRGGNIDCYRTWEALYSGSIPVVESRGIDEVYKDLPVIIVDDLTSLTQMVLDDAFEHLKTKQFNLNKLHADYWLDKIKEAQNLCF